MHPRQSIHVVFVTDEPQQATTIVDRLQRRDDRLEGTTVSERAVAEKLASSRVDCVVVDDSLDAVALIETLRDAQLTLPIVLRTDDSDVDDAIDAGVTGVVPERADERQQLLARWIADAVVAQRTDDSRERRQLEQLQEMTRELMDAPAESIPEQAVAFAREVLDLPVTALALERDGGLTVVAATEEATDLFTTLPSFNDESGLAVHAFETGDPIVVADAREHPHTVDAETPVRSVGIFPLGDHGVLITGSTEPDVLDETDANFGQLLAASVESALDRADRERDLQRQNERLEEFASVVSHDLRSPLNVAQGHLELLQERCDDEALDRIADAHDRMAELIDGVLALARQGRTVGDTELTDVATAARQAWAVTSSAQARLDVREPGAIAADPDRLQQLLENLFRNCIDHAGDDVTVTVGSLDDSGFYVADDGPGLDDPEKVFDRGYSASDEGSGFGLAIVNEIAAAHGWRVDATESDAGGARFEIRTGSAEDAVNSPG